MPISSATPLALGSSSPRRRELLEGLGVPIRVVAPDVAEQLFAGDSPALYLERVTSAKLAAAAAALGSQPAGGLLVADTIVVLDDEIINKPASIVEAEAMLQRLTGRTHVVQTRYAIALPETPGVPAVTRTVTTQVSLRAATADEIRDYAGSGEGLDKAGAYAAQGIGAFLVERVEGSYTNVVGLPACEVVLDLKGLELLQKFP